MEKGRQNLGTLTNALTINIREHIQLYIFQLHSAYKLALYKKKNVKFHTTTKFQKWDLLKVLTVPPTDLTLLILLVSTCF